MKVVVALLAAASVLTVVVPEGWAQAIGVRVLSGAALWFLYVAHQTRRAGSPS